MIKTTSLETSKLLKSAGWTKVCHEKEIWDEWGIIYKPNTDELLEELPKLIKKDCGYERKNKEEPQIVDWYFEIKFREGKWEVGYHWYYYEYMDGFTQKNESLPEALAQMWLWHKKENLI